MNESCARRSSTVVPTQAFAMLNSRFINEEAERFADRVIELSGPDRARQIDQAFVLALSRHVTDAEREEAVKTFGAMPPKEAVAKLGVVLFNLNEFIYIE